jgi:dTDP-4-dehydrorhamnose 3,5-epimerase
MKVIPTALSGVLLLEPKVFGDDRGLFMETFNARTFRDLTGCDRPFVQDNHSRSLRGVLRGLHYQFGAHPQDKLVRAVSGEIFDVAVDIRRGSPTYGQWVGEILSAENKRQLWLPVGFAHGFLVLSETAEVLYKVTDYYDPAGERSIRWDDPDIAVRWPYEGTPLLSGKDAIASAFRDAEVFP